MNNSMPDSRSTDNRAPVQISEVRAATSVRAAEPSIARIAVTSSMQLAGILLIAAVVVDVGLAGIADYQTLRYQLVHSSIFTFPARAGELMSHSLMIMALVVVAVVVIVDSDRLMNTSCIYLSGCRMPVRA